MTEVSGDQRSGGRRLLVGYGIALTVSGLILAGEPDHSKPWRTLGIVAAVIGLVCMLAPMARRPVVAMPEPVATPEPTGSSAAPAAEPVEDPFAGEQAELDRLAAELAEAQAQIDLRAADLAIEQRALDERVAELSARRQELRGAPRRT